MEKVKLSKSCKKLMRSLYKNPPVEPINYTEEEWADICVLVANGFVDDLPSDCPSDIYIPELTQKGIGYLRENPKLKGPSIWDDKKYWITTAISILALVMSIISMAR